MAYTLIIACVLIYAYFVKLDKKTGKEFYKSYFPIFMLLFLVYALQDGVGTDYESYLLSASVGDKIGNAKLNLFIQDREYLFALLLYIARLVHWPQMIFVLTSLIQNVLFAITLETLNKRKVSSFLFLIFYFFLSLSFFNQFNVIRQFLAIHLIVLGFIKLLDSKFFTTCLCFIMAPFFHQSSIVMILFVILFVILKKKKVLLVLLNNKLFYIISLSLLLLYFVDINSIFLQLAKTFNFYVDFVYGNGKYVDKMEITEIATKIVKLVIVYYSIYRLDKSKLNDFEKTLYLFGCISALVMIISFSSSFIWRMYLYFDMFLLFPTLFFFKYDAKENEKKVILLYLLVFLVVKILIIPQGEYLYNSILI